MTSDTQWQSELDGLIDSRLRSLGELDDLAFHAAMAHPLGCHLPALLAVSDYAFEQLRRHPDWLVALGDAPAPPDLRAGEEARWPDQLRVWRHQRSIDLILRDVAGIDRVQDTLRGSSEQAELCCQWALDALYAGMVDRHGVPRSASGQAQQLVVFGLGKLGGSELNFSSDIDLVFAYPEQGETDGARPIDNETFFVRLGQQFIKLLGDTTAEGFGFRVDMRLRPFGTVGRLALSFNAMEQYFQREGRDWERYAWIKARPIAGDIAAGERFLGTLRPFVYRRYFDYTAFDGLREMKAMIEAEVQRRELADHLKLGPGGIREIEFMVQLQQLIRGGREPELRQRGLLSALQALQAHGHIDSDRAETLRAAYLQLRRSENRLQMQREAQVHSLPEAAFERFRLARGLGFANDTALVAALDQQRGFVRTAFEQVFESGRRVAPSGERHTVLVDYWRQIDREAQADMLAQAGVPQAEQAHARLQEFARSSARAQLSARGSARLDRLLPVLLDAIAQRADCVALLDRVLRLLHAVLRRSSYLALLDEQPAARQRLIDTMCASTWMAERLAQHPLLLDDLLDTRSQTAPECADLIEAECTRALQAIDETDPEAVLVALNELRQSVAFRIARATLFTQQEPAQSARQLAWLANVIVRRLLTFASNEVAVQHGRLPGGGLAVLAYGSFGAAELGFNSDLDLVFLYRPGSVGESEGPRPLDAQRYCSRIVQKVLSLLSMQTTAGRLYEADLRLRPDGSKGMLVSTLQSFLDYQRERAWVWEQQALVRARFVAGDTDMGARFDAARREVLQQSRQQSEVFREVAAMRMRMRVAHDRSRDERFDLKQGEGGLVDLEFLLQALVLTHAAHVPALVDARETADLIARCGEAGLLSGAQVAQALAAHAVLLARGLACTLDGRARIVRSDTPIEHARVAIGRLWIAVGLPPTVVDLRAAKN